MHDKLTNQDVYIENYFSISPANDLDDLLEKYYSHSSLINWVDFQSTELGGAYLAKIPSSICSIDFLENSLMTRFKFFIEKILDDLVKNTNDLNFNSICISRGRFKIVPILKKEKLFLDEVSSSEEFVNWFKEKLSMKRITSVNGVIILDGSCNSGLIQLDYAYKRIKTGVECRTLLISSDLQSDYRIKHFNNLGVASRPKQENFPKVFSQDRNGFGYSESMSAVIVSNVLSPIKLLATKHVSDASKIESPDMEQLNLSLAIKNALSSANVRPEEIDLIKLHGSGTQINDIYEFKCLEKIFNKDLLKIPVVAFKTFLGHSFNSANFIELILIINIMKRNLLPRVLNSTPRDPLIGYAPTDIEYKKTFNKVLFLSVGMGGINSACVISRESE